MKEVKIGDSENGYTEIISAEDFADKNIVVKGAYTLLMKMKNTDDE
jgi:cobalt-zinc-cadmium efflux system membrane fusion protein